MSIAANLDFLSRLPQWAEQSLSSVDSPLDRVEDFGANPGNLAMWRFVPQDLPPNSPLVVALHGCTQSAAEYDHGSGWTALAARHGFAVLMPEQQRVNNPNVCFSWFDPDETARGGGEVLSIHRMIAAMVRLHRVSARRIYVTGLSAGGAMASALLAAYPEVFAAGAIVAGLPHGVASNLREALSAMASAPARTESELGDSVRMASSHAGRWPRVSVWHGTSDRVVNPRNADQIVAQWRNVHGLSAASALHSHVDGHDRLAWTDLAGQVLVESYAIADMAHGVPLSLAGGTGLGAEGPFMLEAGIASTERIAEFFGLLSAADAASAGTLALKKPPPKNFLSAAALFRRAAAAAGFRKDSDVGRDA